MLIFWARLDRYGLVSDAVDLCNECEAKFSESSNLKHHVDIHTSGNPYKCQLKCHILKRIGENQYNCIIKWALEIILALCLLCLIIC